MEETEKTLDFWLDNCWSNGTTPWHLKEPNEFLVKFVEYLRDGIAFPTVLVPLCGKTVDLVWLRSQGYTVIAVEGVAKAIQVYQEESGVELHKTLLDNKIKCHQTTDGKIKILEANFFGLSSPSLDGKIDCVWDRASLTAVNPEHRDLYVQTMRKLLKPSFRYLLLSVSYDTSKMEGPPHSVDDEEVRRLFDSFAKITLLEKKSGNTEEPLLPLQPQILNRTIYFMTSK